ncbi:hypothetical protein ACHAWF_014208, partial [Thalassiosira exigua]
RPHDPRQVDLLHPPAAALRRRRRQRDPLDHVAFRELPQARQGAQAPLVHRRPQAEVPQVIRSKQAVGVRHQFLVVHLDGRAELDLVGEEVDATRARAQVRVVVQDGHHSLERIGGRRDAFHDFRVVQEQDRLDDQGEGREAVVVVVVVIVVVAAAAVVVRSSAIAQPRPFPRRRVEVQLQQLPQVRAVVPRQEREELLPLGLERSAGPAPRHDVRDRGEVVPRRLRGEATRDAWGEGSANGRRGSQGEPVPLRRWLLLRLLLLLLLLLLLHRHRPRPSRRRFEVVVPFASFALVRRPRRGGFPPRRRCRRRRAPPSPRRAPSSVVRRRGGVVVDEQPPSLRLEERRRRPPLRRDGDDV